MTTEENDNGFNRHFREAFRSYKADPPPEVWNSVREQLSERNAGQRNSINLESIVDWFRPGNRLYPALTVVVLLLITVFIWLSVRHTNQINGTARINGEALSRGTAYLFHVHDKHKPLDSVMFHQKMQLDTAGRFAFIKVPSGTYFLRIHVHHDAPGFPEYKFGYYGDQLHWNLASLIHTEFPKEDYSVNIPKLTP
ncbi:MAG: hypothetical protein HQ542_11790 [Bacteroidia bacterium]|nr:hypothetical protein [Bacteroidia bacterium]